MSRPPPSVDVDLAADVRPRLELDDRRHVVAVIAESDLVAERRAVVRVEFPLQRAGHIEVGRASSW